MLLMPSGRIQKFIPYPGHKIAKALNEEILAY